MIERNLPVLPRAQALRGRDRQEVLRFAVAVLGRGAGPFVAVENVIRLLRQQPLAQGELGFGRTRTGRAAEPIAAALGLAFVQKRARHAELSGQIARRRPDFDIPDRRLAHAPACAVFAQR